MLIINITWKICEYIKYLLVFSVKVDTSTWKNYLKQSVLGFIYHYIFNCIVIIYIAKGNIFCCYNYKIFCLMMENVCILKRDNLERSDKWIEPRCFCLFQWFYNDIKYFLFFFENKISKYLYRNAKNKIHNNYVQMILKIIKYNINVALNHLNILWLQQKLIV